MLLRLVSTPARFALLLLAAGSLGLCQGASARALFPLDISPLASVEDRGARNREEGAGDFVAEALAQLDLGCDPLADQSLGGNPYADSVIGRIGPELSFGEDEHRLVIAATLSQDPGQAFEYTAALRASSDPALRYVGWLVPAYAAAKSDPDTSRERLPELLRGMEREAPTGLSVADLDYLRAVRDADRGDHGAALDHVERALSAEPQFFNALLLALRLRVVAAERDGARGFSACDAAYRGMFAHLVTLVGLTRCPLQASQAEIYLRRMFRDPEHAPSLLAARVYLGVLARRPALAANALERFDRVAEVSCKRGVSVALHRLLDEAARRSSPPRPSGGV